jgi:hypothetical protein
LPVASSPPVDSAAVLAPSSFGFNLFFLPFVFGRNLQCQLVRGVNTRDEYHWSHT